jgi:hypothetical protein
MEAVQTNSSNHAHTKGREGKGGGTYESPTKAATPFAFSYFFSGQLSLRRIRVGFRLTAAKPGKK